jgi:hydroxymethylpyrimidine pyrophosphatase-like HAD family hydrolase
MEDIRLIATDLDGTLIGSVDEFPLYSAFRERIAKCRRENGALWVVCSGRTMRSFNRSFAPMRAMGLTPDVVIIRHAYIFTRGRFMVRYVPHLLWNLRILLLLWLDRFSSRRAIAEWHHLITRTTHGVRTVRRRKDRLWLRFSTEEASAYAARELQKRVDEFKHFRVFHYRKEVDVRSVPFTKGMALKELTRRLGLTRDNVLAIGNGHNDISALTGEVAAFTGCPGNSEPEVMDAVHHAGGHIANERTLKGVIEIMDAMMQGNVCSDLPNWWEDPKQGDNPSPERPQKRGRRTHLKSIVLGGVALYTGLLVFASFGLVPKSGLIMKPYNMVLAHVEKGFVKFWSMMVK